MKLCSYLLRGNTNVCCAKPINISNSNTLNYRCKNCINKSTNNIIKYILINSDNKLVVKPNNK